jgi:capsular exopolysaccharide synthesis family protein
MVRANLRHFQANRDVRSVLVTSAAAGEGKTTVSWNLACTAAASGARVLLIEAELRKPTFVTRFGVPAQEGLADVLAGKRLPSEVIATIPVGSANGAGPHVLEVIASGGIPPNPSELLESGMMQSLIRKAEEVYDLVIIDTPPLSAVSDAVALVPLVSGVLVVARLGGTTRDAALHLERQLENLDARVLGVVANAIDSADPVYGSAREYQAASARG